MTEYRDHREALCAWLTANGINANDVPIDTDMTIEVDVTGQRWIRCEVFATNAKGERFMNAWHTAAARTRIMTPLQTDPPSWWEPHVKPSREQLLEAVAAVRKLHRAAGWFGQTVCAECSTHAMNGCDSPTVAYPCPTMRDLGDPPSPKCPDCDTAGS